MDNEESPENGLDICLDIDSDLLSEASKVINDKSDGPQIALRFLAHKIQSPQEIEAMYALNVLEKLIAICGHRFIDEVGKFRFLNEVIKVVSPKYLAHRSSPKVKQRVIELMFLWSLEIKEMPKIFEAYQMLKKQGIVTEDPVHILPNYKPPTPPLPRPKDEIFDDERNSQLLQKLLKSGRPEDLEAANLLIKSMAKEADKRMDLKTRFHSEIETVYNNAKVLSDMLTYYSPDNSSAEEKDLMRELFESCERLRLRLFKLANDLTDDDPNLTTLFDANDELTKVINRYKQQFGIITASNGKTDASQSQTISLLECLDIGANCQESPNILHDEELLEDHLSSGSASSNAKPSICNYNLPELGEIFSQAAKDIASPSNDILVPEPFKSMAFDGLTADKKLNSQSKPLSALDELNVLSQMMIKSNLNDENKAKNWNKEPSKTSLNELQKLASKSKSGETDSATNDSVVPLTQLNVSLDSIRPSHCKPITLYDKNDLKVILHLASNSPRIDVKVFVITVINTNHFPVSNINFLAAVPKSMKVKLQPMSATELPAYSALSSPSVITQVMLIARDVNRNDSVRLKYKFSYKINEQIYSDVGEVDSLFDNYNQT